MGGTVELNKLPLLSGADNYLKWADAIKTYLLSQGLWRIVTGERTAPEEPARPTTRSTESDKAIERFEVKLSDWLDASEKAQGAILSTCSPTIRREFIDKGNAKLIWDAIKKKYDVVASVQSFEGLQLAVCTRYDNCNGIQQYIAKMTDALDKCKRSLRTNSTIPEELQIQFLLCNLGEVWEGFLTSYLNSRYDKNKTTFDEVCQVLIQEEMRMKFNSSSTNIVKAQKAKKRLGNDRGTSQDTKKDQKRSKDKPVSWDIRQHWTCNHCGKQGHKSPDCWELHPEKRPGKKKANAVSEAYSEHPNDGGVVKSFTGMVKAASFDHAVVDQYTVIDQRDDAIGQIKVDITRCHADRGDWLIDLGATDHLVADPSDYLPGTKKPFKRAMRTATNQITYSTFIGNVKIRLAHPQGVITEFLLKDVLHVPEVEINILGTIRLGRKGFGVNLLPDEVVITQITTGEIAGYGDIVQNAYYLRLADRDRKHITENPKSPEHLFDQVFDQDCEGGIDIGHVVDDDPTVEFCLADDIPEFKAQEPNKPKATVLDDIKPKNDANSNSQLSNQNPTVQLVYEPVVRYGFNLAANINASINNMDKSRVNLYTWHRRFAHLSIPNVIRTAKAVDGMDIKGLPIPKHPCDPCLSANAMAMHGYTKMTVARRVGHRVFVDIGGGHINMPDAHETGARYWILFVDHYSRFIWVKFMKFKSQAKTAIILFHQELAKEGIVIAVYHTDEGGEFASKDLKIWARKEAIQWEYTAAYAHSQNAIVERVNRTILTRVRAVLEDSQLPKELWAEILRGVVFVTNLSVPRAMIITPYEARYGRKPNVKSLRILGTKGHLTIAEEVRKRKAIAKIEGCVLSDWLHESWQTIYRLGAIRESCQKSPRCTLH